MSQQQAWSLEFVRERVRGYLESIQRDRVRQPANAVVNARKAAEAICKAVIRERSVDFRHERPTLGDLLPQVRRHVSDEFHLCLRTIQDHANRQAHDTDDPREVRTHLFHSLVALDRAVDLFFQEHNVPDMPRVSIGLQEELVALDPDFPTVTSRRNVGPEFAPKNTGSWRSWALGIGGVLLLAAGLFLLLRQDRQSGSSEGVTPGAGVHDVGGGRSHQEDLNPPVDLRPDSTSSPAPASVLPAPAVPTVEAPVLPTDPGDGCEPDCTFRNCGDDGCGRSCGTCLDDFECIAGGCIWRKGTGLDNGPREAWHAFSNFVYAHQRRQRSIVTLYIPEEQMFYYDLSGTEATGRHLAAINSIYERQKRRIPTAGTIPPVDIFFCRSCGNLRFVIIRRKDKDRPVLGAEDVDRLTMMRKLPDGRWMIIGEAESRHSKGYRIPYEDWALFTSPSQFPDRWSPEDESATSK
ncbi:MAG: hypothetical protein ABIK09_19715 [Pseudomonadota bacterium]